MSTERTLTDRLGAPATVMPKSHPRDSSRLLSELMLLSWRCKTLGSDDKAADSVDGIISSNVLRSLLSALYYRDAATIQHSRRVAMLSVGMGEYLGWDEPQLKVLEVAALLHDVGKIGVPDNILFKPGKLSTDEFELMALHHSIGDDMLQACRVDTEILDIVVHSHGYYNIATDGYRPIGRDVHQGARILAVADAYDSMASDQVYRKGKPHEEILKNLHDAAGTQFDGNITAALARYFKRNGLPFSRDSADTGAPVPSAPSDPKEALEANSLCHIFSYLYVLESLYDGFYLVDSDLRYVIWNRGCEKLLGHATQNMLGQVWSSRVLCQRDEHGEPLSELECPMNRVIATGEPMISTLQLQHVDGEWIKVELQSVPLVDQQGRLQGVAEIFRDLSRTISRPHEYRELKLAASRDPLTSVANRGELESQLKKMLSELSQHANSGPLSIIFLDVDFFKNINDTFGHTVGDRVLIDMARMLQCETYSGELVSRYGGEEFVILCPSTELQDAVRRAERLRIAISKGTIGGISGHHKLTASFGVAEVTADDTVESILQRADKALYMAKDSGRNRTCSLSADQLHDENASPDKLSDECSDPFLYCASFTACIAADMVVYKLSGFVDSQQAKVIDVTPKRATIRLGKRGLLPFWGRSDDRRPVELVVELGEEVRSAQRAVSEQVNVTAQVRPLGRVRSSQAFEERARRVVKDLRSYFAAD